MMSIKDWVLSQLVSNSVASARPLSGSDTFFEGEHPSNELNVPGSAQNVNSPPPEAADISRPSVPNQESPRHPSLQQVTFETLRQRHHPNEEKKMAPLEKIEMLQIKFLRLLLRLGHLQDDLMVAKVLYRIHLATLIRAGESDLKRVNLSSDKAKEIAIQQETSGIPELDFSFTVLVLGKTGVGKSSTINSVLNQPKAKTDAFQPATDRVQEIIGTVNGIKICFIDTPGLLPPSPETIGKNRMILQKIKKRIRKTPPDMVLYLERLDIINVTYSDFPLLKLTTEVFGTGIWFNTMLVMTHCSSPLPEGPNGYPVTYESYVTRCTNLIQHYVHQAVSDSNKLENPFLFVENHSQCRTNVDGDKVLPNGQVWKSQFLLSCLCTKILGDVNKLLDFQDRIELGISNSARIPSLPHLLSSFLRHRISNPNATENEVDAISLTDLDDEEDEYDQLPPIRILSKSQYKKLSNSQKNEYLDELDYRETLYLKKQIKEELRARKEKKDFENGNSVNEEEPSEPVLLPEMAIPPSFDSDNPLHRYRCLVSSDQWLARPVLDPHGWDHDVGFDGINLESASKVNKNLYAAVTGQISKDKQDFNIQSECSAAFLDPRGPTYSAALNVQSSGKDLIYTLYGNTKLLVLERNSAECGLSLLSFGKNYYTGAKVEDSFFLGKRLKFVVNGGRMGGGEQAAYGGSLQAVITGKDYPVRNNKASLTMTVMSMNKETVLGGNIESDFRVTRGTNMSINANLNNRNMGQICIKTTSSERLEIALIAAVSIFRVLLRRLRSDGSIEDRTRVE